MNIINLTLVIFLLILSSDTLYANEIPDDKRLKLTRKFIKDYKQGTLTNEQLIKKYCVAEHYFKYDSIKSLVDAIMDNFRSVVNGPIEIEIVKFSGNEYRFGDYAKDIGSEETGKCKRNISLNTTKDMYISVDGNSIYVIVLKIPQDPQEHPMYVLFNDKNKIISFVGWTTGCDTTLFPL